MSESRHERFHRLAVKRVNRILNDVRLLGNLANRSSYDYSDREIWKIFKVLDETIRNSKSKFSFVNKVKFRL